MFLLGDVSEAVVCVGNILRLVFEVLRLFQARGTAACIIIKRIIIDMGCECNGVFDMYTCILNLNNINISIRLRFLND